MYKRRERENDLRWILVVHWEYSTKREKELRAEWLDDSDRFVTVKINLKRV